MFDDIQNDDVENDSYEPQENQDVKTADTQTDNPQQENLSDENQGEQQQETPKKSRAEQRIAELVAERNAERQRVAELEEKLQNTNRLKSNTGEPVEPDIDDFDLNSEAGIDEWLQARNNYEREKERYHLRQLLDEERQLKQQVEHQARLESDFKQAFERNPQFKDNFARLVARFEHTPISIDPSEVFNGQELMDVLDTLATDEELYYELAGMNQTQALMRLGVLQATMRIGKQSNMVKRSNAPNPPNHTKANAPIARDPYEMSDKDFLKSRGLI